MNTKKPKLPTAFRLTEEAKNLLVVLSTKYGISQAAVLELAIREKAEREKVKPNEQNA